MYQIFIIQPKEVITFISKTSGDPNLSSSNKVDKGLLFYCWRRCSASNEMICMTAILLSTLVCNFVCELLADAQFLNVTVIKSKDGLLLSGWRK